MMCCLIVRHHVISCIVPVCIAVVQQPRPMVLHPCMRLDVSIQPVVFCGASQHVALWGIWCFWLVPVSVVANTAQCIHDQVHHVKPCPIRALALPNICTNVHTHTYTQTATHTHTPIIYVCIRYIYISVCMYGHSEHVCI